MSATAKYLCTYANCHEAFSSLRLFESHLATHDPNESMDKIDQNQEVSTSNTTQNEKIGGFETTKIVEELELEDDDIDEDEQSIIQGLLKLSESTSTSESDIKESNTEKTVINVSTVNTPMNKQSNNVQILSITDITPKSKKQLPVIPMLSDRVNAQQKINNTNARFVPKDSTFGGNIAKKNSPRKQPTILRKRKLSEMNCDDLAHLLVKYQDRVSSLKDKLETTQKEVSAIRQLYKKRRKNKQMNQSPKNLIRQQRVL